MIIHQHGDRYTIGGLPDGKIVTVQAGDSLEFKLSLRISDLKLDPEAFDRKFLVPLRSAAGL